jgi:hypothetical protein
MPLTQHTMPLVNVKSYVEWPHWDYRRVKDLGKKWFGFSKMEILTPDEWWKGSIESNQYAIFQEYKY